MTEISDTLAAWKLHVADEGGEELDASATICEQVLRERLHQLKKWGKQNHTQQEWAVIEMEELGEVAREIFEIDLGLRHDKTDILDHVNNLRAEWVQVAAVAIAAIESLDDQCEGLTGYGEVVRE